MSFKFKFLGTGTSVGVPQIGCKCSVCTSADPRDRRRRCGAYVRSGKVAFLVDTPPEMREAALEYGIDRVDAVCLTHAHMDHIAGFDDVRRFNTLNGSVPMRCHAMPETVEQMHRIFPYISDKPNEQGLFRPMIRFRDEASFSLGDISVERLPVGHGFPCCGYLFGGRKGLAYISDCHVLPDVTVERLKGVGTLVINCLRERPHPTHLNTERMLAYVARISPARTFITHICHDIGHAEWQRRLPEGIEPAYDGLELEI